MSLTLKRLRAKFSRLLRRGARNFRSPDFAALSSLQTGQSNVLEKLFWVLINVFQMKQRKK